MEVLKITDLTKRYGDTLALDGVSFTVEAGEIVCLLGPSGCGKTTLLRAIAGLETPEAGQIRYAGQDLAGVPPYQRDFGLMFQDYALFPHKNVEANVAFGLESRRQAGEMSKQEISVRVRQVLDLVGLVGFEHRNVSDLSGGEAQRVALARSLAPSPRLLMLDEPLGSLDRALRERLMVELRQILKSLGLTSLYVTHDQAESFSVADRVVILNQGRIEQGDSPEAIYRRPANAFVAGFLGMGNVSVGKVLGPDCVNTEWGELETDTHSLSAGTRVRVLVRTEAATGISCEAEEINSPARNCVTGRLLQRTFRGGSYQIRLEPDQGPPLTLALSGVTPLDMEPGDTVKVCLHPAGIVLWTDADTETA